MRPEWSLQTRKTACVIDDWRRSWGRPIRRFGGVRSPRSRPSRDSARGGWCSGSRRSLRPAQTPSSWLRWAPRSPHWQPSGVCSGTRSRRLWSTTRTRLSSQARWPAWRRWGAMGSPPRKRGRCSSVRWNARRIRWRLRRGERRALSTQTDSPRLRARSSRPSYDRLDVVTAPDEVDAIASRVGQVFEPAFRSALASLAERIESEQHGDTMSAGTPRAGSDGGRRAAGTPPRPPAPDAASDPGSDGFADAIGHQLGPYRLGGVLARGGQMVGGTR